MKKDGSLFVIIGAGFSYHAGLPLANNIKDFFTRNNVDHILKFGSGESKWVDFADEVDLNNGRLGFDHVAYGYILNELVERFVNERKTFTNYEDMYQFFIDSFKNDTFISSVLENAKQKCLAERKHLENNPLRENYLFAFKHTQADHLKSLINHLIADLLFWRKNPSDFVDKYVNFLNIIAKEKNTTITTLNHDLLLEYFLENIFCLPYSDGFTADNKLLCSQDGKPLRIFQNDFSAQIHLIKLHGSLDTYKYVCYDERPDSSTVTPTGDYYYFKTMNYYEKQHPVRLDPTTGTIVQKFHFEITPQFITGTDKPPLIAADKMYSVLYQKLSNDILSATELMLIGYSYGDKHVNDQIEKALANGNLKKITNVNPGMKFPYDSGIVSVTNLSDITEAS